MRVTLNGRGMGRIQKTIKKCHQIKKISNLISYKTTLQNAMMVGVFLLLSLTISL